MQSSLARAASAAPISRRVSCSGSAARQITRSDSTSWSSYLKTFMLPRACNRIRRSNGPQIVEEAASLTNRQHLSAAQHRRFASTPPLNSKPKTIFSGIQPTGVPHLGNYLGALQRWVSLQNEAETDTTLIYSLVDLHAITIHQEPEQLRQWKKEALAILLAVGLDPKRSIVFHQSDVPAHAELMWILSCQASTGYLGRMTQWKEKSDVKGQFADRLKLGLFSYPVLQAADVLVHGATHVPVGHDQAQHLEFARTLAAGFNHQYQQKVLVEPDTLISPAKRIMSLVDPSSKMSKSAQNPKSRILLADSEEVIRQKIGGALTDSQAGISYDSESRPGVSNLIDILYHTRTVFERQDEASLEGIVEEVKHMHLKTFKEIVADSVTKVLRPIRERYEALIGDEKELEAVAVEGAEKARSSAAPTLAKVRQTIGLS